MVYAEQRPHKDRSTCLCVCVCASAPLIRPSPILSLSLSLSLSQYQNYYTSPTSHFLFLTVNLSPFFPVYFHSQQNTSIISTLAPLILLISICLYLPLHLFSPSLLHSYFICRITTSPPNCRYILSPLHGCYYHHDTFYFSHGVI